MFTAERYELITGEPPPPDFSPCLEMAWGELDARTLGFYQDNDALPDPVARALERFLAYQTQAISQAGGVGAANEAPMQSASLGKFSFTEGPVGICPAARALLPFLLGYARGNA